MLNLEGYLALFFFTNMSTILLRHISSLQSLFADIRKRLCNRSDDIVVLKWFLMSLNLANALAALDYVTGEVNATMTI